jgi:hypothetical protein
MRCACHLYLLLHHLYRLLSELVPFFLCCQDLVVRYRPELDPVLRGLSFRVEGREKVRRGWRGGAGAGVLLWVRRIDAGACVTHTAGGASL